jgi:NAD(P)-dependent dehydrogenase (short-subunit alcohol dehydrogenase family)
MLGLTRAAAKELGVYGITVNAFSLQSQLAILPERQSILTAVI